jgi:hypothetical protein
MAEQDQDRGVALNSHHRATLQKIFRHPTSNNLEWHDVLSLLEAVTDVDRRHDGRYGVTLAGQAIVIDPPRGPDVDEQLIVDLRRLFRAGGIEPPPE